jgi:hypothetical protein
MVAILVFQLPNSGLWKITIGYKIISRFQLFFSSAQVAIVNFSKNDRHPLYLADFFRVFSRLFAANPCLTLDSVPLPQKSTKIRILVFQISDFQRFSFFWHSHSQQPAVISSTFLLLHLFALLCGHNPARYQQPATRHFLNRHKKIL